MKRKKKILGILMSAIMVFSMSSQFALAAQTKSDAGHNTAPGISTEKEAESSAKTADKQGKETMTEVKDKNDQTSKSDNKNTAAEKKDDNSAGDEQKTENEKKEDKDVVYNKTVIAASKASGGITVQVTAPTGSFPEGTRASVKLVSALESDVTFDIMFTDKNGKEVQPRNGKRVSVDFTVAENSTLIAEKGSTKLSVYHINDDGSADMIGSATTRGKSAKIETESDHFSNFVVRGAKAPSKAPPWWMLKSQNLKFRIWHMKRQHRSFIQIRSIWRWIGMQVQTEWICMKVTILM